MQIANILPGQWKQHWMYQYAHWVHRLIRAIGADIKELPEKIPPLPWPVQPPPVEKVRQYNSKLFPEFPVKPKRRAPLNSYVPRTIDLSASRTEVYRPEKKDDFLWRISFCWDQPRPWSIEAVVDPGSRDYLRFFREVTIRLPLKAKICCELKAGRDGTWKGACRRVKKLNAREPLVAATKGLLEKGQAIQPPINKEQLTMNNGKQEPSGSSPGAHGSLLTAHSPGVAAYRSKVAERERRLAEDLKPPRQRIELPPFREVFGLGPWPMRYESCDDIVRREQEREQLDEIEREVMQGLFWSMPWTVNASPPAFLSRDDHDGYFLTRREIGPDPYEYDRPEPHWETTRWGRKIKRALTARERLTKVKPSIRIVPTGPRSSELVITRRFHEVTAGLKDALGLARMIEGAIKRRDVRQPDRKRSWRQQLGDRIVNDYGGLLTWLVRNPLDKWDHGLWTRDSQGRKTLDLGPAADPSQLFVHPRLKPPLTDHFPQAVLPKHYLGLVARQWLTEDGNLFAATPGGDFSTTVMGYPVHLPVAVMPPAVYERWLARGGGRTRKSRRRSGTRRRRSRANCICFLATPVFRTLVPRSNPKRAFSLRN